MTRKQIFSWFFIGIFLFLIYLFYQIIKPFALSLFWAGILVKFLIPMTDEQKNRIFKRFYDTLTATVLGVIATAGVQGILLGLIFWILGISFPVLAGVLSFILSLLPVGGSIFVWLPVGVYLFLIGSTFKGIELLILGAILSSVDHFLKPAIIGGRAKLPTLFLFLSIFGGVKAFGFSGIILGPVLLVAF